MGAGVEENAWVAFADENGERGSNDTLIIAAPKYRIDSGEADIAYSVALQNNINALLEALDEVIAMTTS